ncbi:MAG: patatin-like phospholipase family protein, partial [Acidobacteriota bacterium]
MHWRPQEKTSPAARRWACALAISFTLGAAGAGAEEPPSGPPGTEHRADHGTDVRPKIGVALAGGGAKGCAHIGVLQVFEELGIPVDYVAGTSMGSVIGGLYATGYSADTLAELVTAIDWTKAMRDKPSRSALAFRRKQDDLRYPLDLELGYRDGRVLWPRGLSSGQNLFLLLRSYTLPVNGIEDFDRLPIPFRGDGAER